MRVTNKKIYISRRGTKLDREGTYNYYNKNRENSKIFICGDAMQSDIGSKVDLKI